MLGSGVQQRHAAAVIALVELLAERVGAVADTRSVPWLLMLPHTRLITLRPAWRCCGRPVQDQARLQPQFSCASGAKAALTHLCRALDAIRPI